MAPLSSGFAKFPDTMVKRHPDAIYIATANTWGLGGTSDYVGRTKQDASSLDRFAYINWTIDEALEDALAGNKTWTSVVRKYRQKAEQKGLKVLITPRASILGAALLRAGIDMDSVKESVIKKGMTTDQWAMIN